MINLLLGAPGGGKSYEAVVFHILPAIQKGRKVITNLPVNLDEFEKIHPGSSALFDIRTQTKAPKPIALETTSDSHRVTVGGPNWRPIPFWHPEDFADPWRHPEKGFGPLYVIDECHIPLPVRGTMLQVEEWFSLHRHHNADVLLITQSYGKINAAIRDLVQVVYRVRKNVALGSMGSYTRKVQDGLRGEVVNTSIRKYEPKNFPLYKSHTQSKSGSELGANDIKPIWQHWSFIGAALMLVLFVGILASGEVKNPLAVAAAPGPTNKQTNEQTNKQTGHSAALPAVAPARPLPPPPVPPAEVVHAVVERPDPYENKGLHLLGSVTFGGKTRWLFVVSQNGAVVNQIDDAALAVAGFSWESAGDCVGWLRYTYDKARPPRPVSCDSPKVGMMGQST